MFCGQNEAAGNNGRWKCKTLWWTVIGRPASECPAAPPLLVSRYQVEKRTNLWRRYLKTLMILFSSSHLDPLGVQQNPSSQISVTSQHREKCPSQLPGVQGDVFKSFVPSDQQSKTLRYSVHNHREQTADPHTGEAGNSSCSAFSIKKWLEQLIDYQNCWYQWFNVYFTQFVWFKAEQLNTVLCFEPHFLYSTCDFADICRIVVRVLCIDV